jgi:hypothetical protein
MIDTLCWKTTDTNSSVWFCNSWLSPGVDDSFNFFFLESWSMFEAWVVREILNSPPRVNDLTSDTLNLIVGIWGWLTCYVERCLQWILVAYFISPDSSVELGSILDELNALRIYVADLMYIASSSRGLGNVYWHVNLIYRIDGWLNLP